MHKLISGSTAAILDYRKQLKMLRRCLCYLVAQTYSGKATKAFLSTPSGSAAVVKNRSGGNFTPFVIGRLNQSLLFLCKTVLLLI
jgi:hypothetical protein